MINKVKFEEKGDRDKYYQHNLVQEIVSGLVQEPSLLRDVGLVLTERNSDAAKKRKSELLELYSNLYSDEKTQIVDKVTTASLKILEISDSGKRNNLLGAVVELFVYSYFENENNSIQKSSINCFIHIDGDKAKGDVDCGFIWRKEGHIFECKLSESPEEREIRNLSKMKAKTQNFLRPKIFTFITGEEAKVRFSCKDDIDIWGRDKILKIDLSDDKFP